MSPTELHVYQCPVCKATLTVTVKVAPRTAPYRCRCSSSWMRFLFSEPIVDEADRALAKLCPVWQNAGVTTRGVHHG